MAERCGRRFDYSLDDGEDNQEGAKDKEPRHREQLERHILRQLTRKKSQLPLYLLEEQVKQLEGGWGICRYSKAMKSFPGQGARRHGISTRDQLPN